MSRFTSRLPSRFALLALIVLAAMTGVGGWAPGLPQWLRLVLHALTMIAAFVAAGFYVHHRAGFSRVARADDLTWRAQDASAVAPAAPTVSFELGEISRGLHLDPDVLSAFTDTICNPSRVRRSVDEIIDIGPTHATRTLHVQLDLAVPADRAAVVMLLRERKGTVEDNATVSDVSGTALPLLSRMDSGGLLWATVRELVNLAYFPTGVTPAQSQVVAEIELYYAAHVALPIGAADVLTPPTATPVDLEAAQTLEMLLHEMKDHYPVIAVIPPELMVRLGDSATVRVTHRSTSPTVGLESSNAKGARRFGNMVRRMLFVSNLQFQVNAIEARRCSDYHLTVNAPAGALTGDVRFCDDDRPIKKDPTRRRRLTNFHIRFVKPRQQAFAHLYTRNFGRSSYDAPRYYVTFFEELPGAVGRAVIAAWALTWVVWITSISFGAPASAADVGPDSLALVLTLQGGLLAWITSDAIRHPHGLSLSARASMVSTAALSLAAALSLVTKLSGRAPDWHLPEQWSYWYLNDALWAGLLAATVLNAGLITLTLLVRRRRGGM